MKSLRSLALSCLVVPCVLGVSSTLYGQSKELPDGVGKAEFKRICSACHETAVATRQKMSKEDWSATIDKMVGFGAQGSDEDLEKVLTYLSTNFGPEKSSKSDSSSSTGFRQVSSQAKSHASSVEGMMPKLSITMVAAVK